MATQYDGLSEDHIAFVRAQQLFFTATAAPEGRVNLSPKGMDSLRVVGANKILWLNYTGSGNETAAHLRLSDRMTLMWCSFGARALILRAYGHARAVHQDDNDWDKLAAPFDADYSTRQIFEMTIDMVQTSCGYGVPKYDLAGERGALQKWAEARGPDGVRAYWAERNAVSIDGLPTGVPDLRK